MELAHGIAHVSFRGGGFFLPARDPYDRQTLIEHITQYLRTKGHVQVLLDNHRWIVHPRTRPLATNCAACGQAAEAACYANTSNSPPHCLGCALGGRTHVEQLSHEEWRQVG
jgi:hypothetical protein